MTHSKRIARASERINIDFVHRWLLEKGGPIAGSEKIVTPRRLLGRAWNVRFIISIGGGVVYKKEWYVSSKIAILNYAFPPNVNPFDDQARNQIYSTITSANHKGDVMKRRRT